MAVKGINGADLNNISEVDGRYNVLNKVNGVDADLVPPAAAYSVRNLSDLTGVAYDGPAMRILVDATGDGADASDDEFDINFTTDGDLDVADIELKCAGGKDAYVVKWYDQSGAGNDAEQATYVNMPKICSGGTVILENGKPAIDFDGTSHYLISSTWDGSSIDNLSHSRVYSTPSAATANSAGTIWSFGHSSNSSEYVLSNASTVLLSGEYVAWSWANFQSTPSFNHRLGSTTYRRAANTQVLEFENWLSTGFSFFQDGLSQTIDLNTSGWSTSSVCSPSITPTNRFGIGVLARPDEDGLQAMKAQELIYWDVNRSGNRPTIENNINSYFNIYQSRENLLPGAAAAYSLRQLSSSSRVALRVRRNNAVGGSSGDDDEADVGFDANGEVSLKSPVSNFDPTGSAATTLGEFLADAAYEDKDSLGSPSQGVVSVWYDQSGNSRDLEQTFFGAQPEIYNGSTGLNTINGKPYVLPNSGDILITTTIDFNSINTFFAVVYSSSPGSFNVFSADGNPLYVTDPSNPTSGVSYGFSPTPVYYHNGVLQSTMPTRSEGADFIANGPSLISSVFGDRAATDVMMGREVGQQMAPTQELILYYADKETDGTRSDIESNINAHYGIENFGTPSSGLLAEYPGSAAAYSVRKLADTAGVSMRIIVDDTAAIGTVDASDTEYDIGFDANGELDVARIREVCNNPSGANYNAYVVTWYDQSGNGNHATQATYTQCPQIYDGTDVVMENGKPAIQWDATSQTFLETGTYDAWSDGSCYTSMVFNGRQGPAGSQTYWDIESGVMRYSSGATNIFALFYGSNDQPQTTGVFTEQGLHTFYSVASETDAAIYIDGSLEGSTTRTASVGDQNVTACIGTRGGGSQYNDCKYQEIIHWGSDVASNRKAIESDIDSYYRIYGDPDDGLLSTPYGEGAAVAYSVRRLSNSATRAMRIIVDDTDTVGALDANDTEYDIGFDANGELDIARIEEVCDKGGNNYDAYVVTWYDQSGNGNDATQATYTSMPQIVSSGSVILENGKPAVDFDGSDDVLTTGSFDITDGEWYASAVCTQSALSTAGKIWSADQRAQTRVAQMINMFNGTSRTIAFTTSTVIHDGPTYTAGEQCLLTAQNQSNALEVFKNGSGTGSEDGSNQVTGTRTADIGAAGVANNEHNGTIQEIIHWSTTQSNRTLIESNINDYFNIEGL